MVVEVCDLRDVAIQSISNSDRPVPTPTQQVVAQVWHLSFTAHYFIYFWLDLIYLRVIYKKTCLNFYLAGPFVIVKVPVMRCGVTRCPFEFNYGIMFENCIEFMRVVGQVAQISSVVHQPSLQIPAGDQSQQTTELNVPTGPQSLL
jgi:hypothetical protein